MSKVIRVAAVGVIAAVFALGAPALARKHPPAVPKCRASAHTVIGNAQIRLFRLKHRYYTCWRPTGRVTLAYPHGREGAGAEGQDFSATIAGHYAGFFATSLYDPDGNDSEIVSVDARSGRSVHRSYADMDVNADSLISSFVMDDHGSLAFLEGFNGGPRKPGLCPQSSAALIALDRHGRRVLDCQNATDTDAQKIANLTISGHVVSWQHLGSMRSAVLG
jgi:hypothetical protein